MPYCSYLTLRTFGMGSTRSVMLRSLKHYPTSQWKAFELERLLGDEFVFYRRLVSHYLSLN